MVGFHWGIWESYNTLVKENQRENDLKLHQCRFENLPIYLCSYKQYPENFVFLIIKILELFAREVCKFLKMQANF